MKNKLIPVAAILLLLGSCYNDKYDKLYPAPPVSSNTCDTTTIKYSTDIQPIMNAYCAINGGCHNAAGNATTHNLDFTILSVLQGQSTADLMLNDINGTPSRGHNSMPLGTSKLSACNINKITRWVNEGAPNN